MSADTPPSELAATHVAFDLVAKLGEGTSGEAWCARVRTTGREVALKIGRGDVGEISIAREAAALALAPSPRIPRIVDAGRAIASGHGGVPTGTPWIALERMPGRALEPRAALDGEGRRALALLVARDVGGALADLHRLGLAHGDVKPANVVVEPGAGAALVDLGLAQRGDAQGVLGATPRYLAPEALAPDVAGSARALDLYALGLTLAETLDAEVAASTRPEAAALAARLPAPFDRVVPALLSRAPGARPSAAWVRAEAVAACGAEPDAMRRARNLHRVRSAYLSVRRAEIARRAASHEAAPRLGEPVETWLGEALAVARAFAPVPSEAHDASAAMPWGDADDFTRRRWLVAIFGPDALGWPLAPAASEPDAVLAGVLVAALGAREPASIRADDVERARAGASAPRGRALRAPAPADDVTALDAALALGAARPDAEVVSRVELDPAAPRVLRLAAADALRRAGEHGRALALLGREPNDAVALALSAECRRAAHDRQGAARDAEAALAIAPDDALALATRARLALDAGAPDEALARIAGARPSARVEEVRAIAALAKGERAAADRALALARSLAGSDEERARLAGVEGYLAHERGDAECARAAYARAAEHAARAGTVVEEATYLAGLAAAASDAGEAGAALAAAERASLLFAHVGRPADAARALLARAASFASVGARAEAVAASNDARAAAEAAGDTRAALYALFSTTDVARPREPVAAVAALGAAAEARALGGEGACGAEDALRAGARVLVHAPERVDATERARLDALAARPDLAASARLDWWGARALDASEAEGRVESGAEAIVRACMLLVSARAPAFARAVAFERAATLATRLGDGESARALRLAGGEAVARLRAGCPAELRLGFDASQLARGAERASAPALHEAQIAELTRLVRSLAARTELRPVLEQALDALVFWTGVERGVLLLPAPGGRLVPRVARNLARDELRGDALALSQSLARRAWDLGEPVVAFDAAGELASLHASAHALHLRSVLAVPLVARGETLGVAYLDDRVRRGAFGAAERAWVRVVAEIAAIAIADARDRVRARRDRRRAERARAALDLELARRDAELGLAREELSRTRGTRVARHAYDRIVGESEPVARLLALVDRVAASDVPALVVGESGTGKELVARAIHENGRRAARPFVVENCAAAPEALLESELFGHVRGAFTGAERSRTGLFELAHGGTLFLDEVGEMGLAMQARLLRVLEDGEVRPLGAERGRKVDVRVVAATHRDLRAMAATGAFRADLLYRLEVVTLRVPSLRERRDDVAALVGHFVRLHAGTRSVRVTRAALARLTAFDWPGNVRQLENEIRRALVLADDTIDEAHLSPEIVGEPRAGGVPRSDTLDLRGEIDALETRLLREALARTSGNRTRAAASLGVSRFGLQKMMRRLGVEATRESAVTKARPRRGS